jgi:hypothetical protein
MNRLGAAYGCVMGSAPARYRAVDAGTAVSWQQHGAVVGVDSRGERAVSVDDGGQDDGVRALADSGGDLGSRCRSGWNPCCGPERIRGLRPALECGILGLLASEA